MRVSSYLAVALFAIAAPAMAQQQPAPASGQAVFERACAACHTPGAAAPAPDVLRQMSPDVIHNALTNGKMQVQGSTLTDAERRAVSEFLGGRPLAAQTAATGAPPP